MTNYSADIGEILRNAPNLIKGVGIAEGLAKTFNLATDAAYGWWGTEGDMDDFANEMGPQVREEDQKLESALLALSQAVRAVYDSVSAQTADIQKPQNDALDSINQASSDPGSARR